MGAWAGIVAGFLMIVITAMALTAFEPVRSTPHQYAVDVPRIELPPPPEVAPQGF